ncbi:zinc knuckle CX2CX4HX4C containing protein [Tanacetum coccineum]
MLFGTYDWRVKRDGNNLGEKPLKSILKKANYVPIPTKDGIDVVNADDGVQSDFVAGNISKQLDGDFRANEDTGTHGVGWQPERKQVAFPVFSCVAGLEGVLEHGLSLIHNFPFVLRKWTLSSKLSKEELTYAPVWIKFHGVHKKSGGVSSLTTSTPVSNMFSTLGAMDETDQAAFAIASQVHSKEDNGKYMNNMVDNTRKKVVEAVEYGNVSSKNG